jgi:zinc/manganese transport system substrate-binding protein
MSSNSRRAAWRCLVTAVCCLATTACAGASTAAESPPRVTVVSSTNVWGDIAQQVGGQHVQVTALLSSPAQDPHEYIASARDELAVSKADVVIENGGGYDDFVDRLLEAVDAHATVIDAVDVSGLSSPSGGRAINEHVWYDLPTAEEVARRMATAFGHADPPRAAEYHRNAAAFDSSVEPLVHRESMLKRRYDGVRVAVTEPVAEYMLGAIGAVDVTPVQFSAAVEEGNDVSVAALDETLTLLRDHHVAALVYNAQTSDPLTDRAKDAALDSGVPVVAVTETLPDADSYATWMAGNLDDLETALSNP